MQDGKQEWKPERGRDGEIGQLLFLSICFQPWWQNSCFDPFSLLSTTCPLVQRLAGSQWVCCPWQPPACAHACSSFLTALPPVMGQRGNAKLCLQAAYLFHSPATLHLFRCCSGAYRGEIFSCLSIPEDVWVVGFFYYYFRKSFFHFLFHCFIASLCKYITSSPFAMDCGCCRVIWLSIKPCNTKLLSSLVIEITLWCLLYSNIVPLPFISVQSCIWK